MQIEELRAQAKLMETRGTLELQAANDQRDSERETMKAMHERELEGLRLELDRYKTDADNQTRIQVALINQQGKAQAAAFNAAQKQDANDRTADQQPGA
jgi:hypothetical protein